MKKPSVFGAFWFSEFRIRDCIPVLLYWNMAKCSFVEVDGHFRVTSASKMRAMASRRYVSQG
jgi:hypothetical protein